MLFSLCCPPAKAEAIWASVKSSGMGGAAIAYPLDSLCIAYNPAGLLLVGERIDGGFYYINNTGRIDIDNSLTSDANDDFNGMSGRNIYLGDAGISGTFCWEYFQFALGVAAYDRFFQRTHFDRVETLFGTTKQGFEYIDYTVSPAIAFSICECHSLGVSVNWEIARLKIEGLENFDDPFVTIHRDHVTNKGRCYSHGVSATVGWRTQLFDSFAFGAVYTSRAHMSKFKKYDGFLVKGRIDIPERIGVGFAWYACPPLVIAFDAEWIRWSGIHSRTNRLLHNNTLFFLGTQHGPGFGFKDQWCYRVGVDYCLSDCWTVRAGYRYTPTVVRSSQAFFNSLTLDLVQNWLTVGATYRYNCCNEFSAFFAYGFRHKIRGENSIPLIPFGGGSVKLCEEKWAVGIEWSLLW